MRVQHILFVCTGNTCRSPMAEGLFSRMVKQRNKNWQARSAGVSASGGSPVSRHAATILNSKGASDKQRSDFLANEWIEWADLVLTMTSSHKYAVIHRFPGAADKVYTLKEFVEDDPRILQIIVERGELESELQIKQALAERIHDHDLQRLAELERQLPDLDIQDPFGGSMQEYEACAREIEEALVKLIAKLDASN
jgi:protein-tyrosine-phosphatase